MVKRLRERYGDHKTTGVVRAIRGAGAEQELFIGRQGERSGRAWWDAADWEVIP
jgi:hypothetical protein